MRLVAITLGTLIPTVSPFLAPASRMVPLGSGRLLAPAPALARAGPHVVGLAGDENEALTNAYRTLGVSEDATYDQIMDAFMELSEKFTDQPARLGAAEAAKEKILDNRLRQRMAGTLQASYEGRIAREDAPPPPGPPPIWVVAAETAGKLVEIPKPKYALNVVGLIGGLSIASLISNSIAGTALMINFASAAGFIYNRGTPEVARDDFGQIGEIRPLKPKPFALTVAMCAAMGFGGWYRMLVMYRRGTAPDWLPRAVLKTSIISALLIVGSLFLKVQDVFDD